MNKFIKKLSQWDGTYFLKQAFDRNLKNPTKVSIDDLSKTENVFILLNPIEIPSSKGGSYTVEPMSLISPAPEDGENKYEIFGWKGGTRYIPNLDSSDIINYKNFLRRAAFSLGASPPFFTGFDCRIDLTDNISINIYPTKERSSGGYIYKLIMDIHSPEGSERDIELKKEDFESIPSFLQAISQARIDGEIENEFNRSNLSEIDTEIEDDIPRDLSILDKDVKEDDLPF